MSPTPDQAIAQDNFSNFKSVNFPKLSDDDAFERFAVNLVTKRYGLGPSEMADGIVGASNDGGIDGMYVLLNGRELVESSSIRLSNRKQALDGIQNGVMLDVIVVQAKNETSWDTNVFSKIQSALKLILKMDVTASELRDFPLNDNVVEFALMLQKLRQKLSRFVPVMSFTVQYVTFAPQSTIDQYMETKRSQLERFLVDKLPTGSSVVVEHVGDASIVTRLRETTDFFAELILAKPAVRVGTALVGVVTIENYLTFIRDAASGAMRDELFAVNVRDYAGSKVRVNGAIAETLASANETEFWWLNNGITVLADAANDPIELHWQVTNPLIVNGLQTSHVIHEQAAAGKIATKRLKQHVLVRLIIETDSDQREEIIRGTNNQTSIASTQLHANDEDQIRIEEYLRSAGWYYERRRYQHRGQTVPAGRTKTITDVAQAVIAFRLLEPDTARARPGSLIANDTGWKRVFTKEGEDRYLKSLIVAEAIDTFLRKPAAKGVSDDATNSRHYLAAGYALRSSGVKKLADFHAMPTASLKSSPTDKTLLELHKLLHAEAMKLDDGKIARDRIFKGARLKPAFFDAILKLNGA